MRNEELNMKADNPIQAKSYAFALRMVKLYRYLCTEKKEFVLSKQMVRSGTSIGANVEEAMMKDGIGVIPCNLDEAQRSQLIQGLTP